MGAARGLALVYCMGYEDFNAEDGFAVAEEEHIGPEAIERFPLHRNLVKIKIRKVQPSPPWALLRVTVNPRPMDARAWDPELRHT